MDPPKPLQEDVSLRVPALEVVDISSDEEAVAQRHPGMSNGNFVGHNNAQIAPSSMINGSSHEKTDGNATAGESSSGEEEGDNDEEDEEEDDDAVAEGWESQSLYEDALDGMGEEQLAKEADSLTVEEAMAYRKRLREVGPDKFVMETIEAEIITAKKLCTAFGIRPPVFLEGAPDEAYYPLLGLGITRELSKRLKLQEYNTVDDAVELLKKSKNIIVLTGAGISTSLGIPDFRSKETGLYSQLAHLGLNDPQEVFDIDIFREDPSIFYSVAKDILPSTKRFSPTHGFIHLLQEKGKLLTNYTQNIDNIEGLAGIRPEKMIQCHGSFATASCVRCKYNVPGEEIYEDLRAGRVAKCQRCTRTSGSRPTSGMKRKRSSEGNQKDRRRRSDDDDESDFDEPEPGVMKPDITFFGEALPDTFHDRLVKHDRNLVDLVVVIGTSLKVAPVSEVVGFLPPEVPQIYVSRTPVSHVNFDIDLLGDCDVVVAELCRRAGWDLNHEMVPADEKVDIRLHEGYSSRFTFKIVDPGAKPEAPEDPGVKPEKA
ncbi:SIR2-domain-containing protein [Xylona heveae TC161]|uniref:SIR2-domain-containing protein n=1 Tax=Xylona heveae (strain CBS 132557 / TC161) TaxID=1328760 RepID=A0A165GKY0_XYLHT|nr:SIR2-domain-containing protein [Xylona heveae TC161]KZF22318.1 SIR2-domain-containing protein [Xylona heveae TC161]